MSAEEYVRSRHAGPVWTRRWFVPAEEAHPLSNRAMSQNHLNIGGRRGLDIQVDIEGGRPTGVHLWVGSRGVHIWLRPFAVHPDRASAYGEDDDAR